MQEPILQENPNRFVIFPIQYNDIWEYYKMHQAAFWTAEEIDLSKDVHDWENVLTEGDRNFVSTILAFFAASDGIVFENLELNFSSEVQISEARAFYAYQGFNETIHGETYSLMIDKLVKDPLAGDPAPIAGGLDKSNVPPKVKLPVVVTVPPPVDGVVQEAVVPLDVKT